MAALAVFSSPACFKSPFFSASVRPDSRAFRQNALLLFYAPLLMPLPTALIRQRLRLCMGWGLGGLAALGLLAALYFQWPALGFYWAHSHWQKKPNSNALWLPDYRAVVQAKPVAGVADNLSGLSFNTETGTLFATINRPPRIVELSADGELLRSIALHGAHDTEGISHVQGQRFLLGTERHNAVYVLDIGPHTRSLQVGQPWALPLRSLHPNLGLEALDWDAERQCLLAGQEKWPLRLLCMAGWPAHDATPTATPPAPPLHVAHEWRSQGWGALFITDLASVSRHKPSGHMLLLSEESRMVVEYSPQGRPVSLLPLWRGLHGLQRNIPQAEGMALAPDGRLFIVSEPNLFYRFEKPAQPTSVL